MPLKRFTYSTVCCLLSLSLSQSLDFFWGVSHKVNFSRASSIHHTHVPIDTHFYPLIDNYHWSKSFSKWWLSSWNMCDRDESNVYCCWLVLWGNTHVNMVPPNSMSTLSMPINVCLETGSKIPIRTEPNVVGQGHNTSHIHTNTPTTFK